MVHVFCLNENCRKVLHLDSHKHWDFKGKVKCIKCGAEMNIEIKNGELKSLGKPQRNSLLLADKSRHSVSDEEQIY